MDGATVPGAGMSLYETVIAVLAPLVGRPAAEICIHSSAMQLGKSSQGLTAEDLPTVVDNIRAKMRPFTTNDLLEGAIAEITRRVA